MINFFEFLDSNKQIIKSNNIDYINNHFELFKYFRYNNISFGKYYNQSYKYIYNNDKLYCKWLKNNVKNTNNKFINFLKKYDCKYKNEKFIFPDINKDKKFLLFNNLICINNILDKIDEIYSVFFTMNFY